jgi:primosomal protein N'
MKILKLSVLLAACFGILSSVALGQGGAPPPANAGGKMKMHAAMMMSAKFYACDKCDMAAMHGGKCPGCGQKMHPINATAIYACEACHKESTKPGKCPKCHKAMQEMAMTYACEMCHTSAKKAGKCPKCGMAMKKTTMKMMPK